MTDAEREHLFLQGVRLFNAREFFACHDVWEEVWSETLGEDRGFFQGLIHCAVALHHFDAGNLGGARKMHDSALKYLQPYEATHWGMQLEQFRADFDRCFAPLLGSHDSYPSGITLSEELIPQIVLKPLQ